MARAAPALTSRFAWRPGGRDRDNASHGTSTKFIPHAIPAGNLGLNPSPVGASRSKRCRIPRAASPEPAAAIGRQIHRGTARASQIETGKDRGEEEATPHTNYCGPGWPCPQKHGESQQEQALASCLSVIHEQPSCNLNILRSCRDWVARAVEHGVPFLTDLTSLPADGSAPYGAKHTCIVAACRDRASSHQTHRDQQNDNHDGTRRSPTDLLK